MLRIIKWNLIWGLFQISHFADASGEVAPETVVASDLRYLNEVRVCQDILWEKGWKVRTVFVSTAGVGPANDEELDSICELKAEHTFDQEFVFAPNSRQQIMNEGRHLALSWNL